MSFDVCLLRVVCSQQQKTLFQNRLSLQIQLDVVSLDAGIFVGCVLFPARFVRLAGWRTFSNFIRHYLSFPFKIFQI
jgi:hypothetical protein